MGNGTISLAIDTTKSADPFMRTTAVFIDLPKIFVARSLLAWVVEAIL